MSDIRGRSTIGGPWRAHAGAKGDELERVAKDETDALVPKHTYVPWLVVEGVPLLDGYANLQTFICVALPRDVR